MTGIYLHKFLAGFRPLVQLEHPREMIRQFTPNWFAATMGTGILSLALPQVPGAGSTLRAIGEGLWLFNIFLFALFTVLYTMRWIMFWDEAKRIFSHSIVSMFIGTIPMGLATIINGFLSYGLMRWGSSMVEVAQVLWWVDVALSLGCGVLIPYFMFTRQQHDIDKMTAVWLLPIVAAEVAASTGGLLVPHLIDTNAQFITLITSYALWAYSVPVAFCVLTILFLRMALHRIPPDSMAASSWLSLGPIGTGAFGMLILGGDAPTIFAAQGMSNVGMVASGFGVIAGVLLWGVGLWWLLLALLITIRHLRAGIPFNLGWWGYTFPLGVYALATLKLGALLGIGALSAFGTMLVIVLAMMWTFVAVRTLHGAWQGHLFSSPCIANIN